MPPYREPPPSPPALPPRQTFRDWLVNDVIFTTPYQGWSSGEEIVRTIRQMRGDYSNDTSSPLTWRRREIVWGVLTLPFAVAAWWPSDEKTAPLLVSVGVTLVAVAVSYLVAILQARRGRSD